MTGLSVGSAIMILLIAALLIAILAYVRYRMSLRHNCSCSTDPDRGDLWDDESIDRPYTAEEPEDDRPGLGRY